MSVGQYVAHEKVDNLWITGIGKSHTEAMLDLFKTLKWMNLGNWSPFQHQAVEDLEKRTDLEELARDNQNDR